MGKEKDFALLQHMYHSSPTASNSSSSSRYASEELIVPDAEGVNSVYYGVDAFSPTLVDFYTVDQKRIVWSSRAHRKMLMTLYRAWHGKHWKLYSFSFWASTSAIIAYACFIVGFMTEAFAHGNVPANVHEVVDIPLLVGAAFYTIWHIISYFEVINCCHNLEIWLDEYFTGREPLLEMQFIGVFPSRIDFWTEILGIFGSLLFVFARLFVLVRAEPGSYGVIDVKRDDFTLILGYWLPFFAGSFLLLLSAYLAHVEVVHQWFSCRLTTLETWVTGLNLLGMVGFFFASTLQFMDPFSAIFSFELCMVPFGLGCFLGLTSSILSLAELEFIHQRHKHPEYGLLKNPSGYGTWN